MLNIHYDVDLVKCGNGNQITDLSKAEMEKPLIILLFW